jgi:beta-lactam-binding protein with PASTA domain
MAIIPFIATTVLPGQPMTAQAWNDIVNAIAAIIGHIDATESTSVRVAITNAGIDPLKTRVTAVRDDGLTAEAVAPVPPSTEFVFTALKPGAYALRAEAPGFAPATANVLAPSAAVVSMTMTPSGAFMPVVFGDTLQAALGKLADLNIAVSRVLDVVGKDVAPANPGPDYNDAPVLMQFPDAGQPVPPGGSVQLVVAASLEVVPSIEIPSLSGLTLSEAQKALEGIGLVLGKVTTTQSRSIG